MAKTKTKTKMSMGSISKRYEELTFADDFMFGKVMEDKELCREVLECLLQEPVGELTDMQTQRQFCYTKDGKPIRLDLYAGNEETMYDAEMQQLHHKKLGELELPKRSRFYQSMMDADFLQKGQSYRRDGCCFSAPLIRLKRIYRYTAFGIIVWRIRRLHF